MLVLYERATLSNSGKLSKVIKFEVAKNRRDTTMSEIWKKITEYENYSVSSTGDIRNDKTNRVLRHYVRNGYKSVTLSSNNVKKTVNIHAIVANAFLQKPDDNTYIVNHINEDKLDNNLSNLEFTTYRENTMHSMSSKRTRDMSSFTLSEFKCIPNYKGYMISTNGKVYSKYTKRLCKSTILPCGYHKIKIKSDAGLFKDMYIHVLVAMTYLDYLPKGNDIVVNHKDLDKGNNSLDNLEVITHKENMMHSVRLNHSKLFKRAVHYIDEANVLHYYKSAKEASDMTGIDNSSILKSCKSAYKKAGNFKWHYTSNS